MASSSVSQESIEIEDYDLCTRRSRIRMMRGRTTAGAHGKTEYHESMESGDHRDPREDELGDLDTNGVVGDHDSPTRLASRLKDKRMGRPNHLHKGKAAKDKRKLREKRRSTGVVHLQQPTESTGDSLDEDETRKNTAYNEFIDEDNPQTPEEERKAFAARSVRNKSPSDLEADLEDNQDYDSTVSQSETNLTTIGHSSSNGNSYQSDSPVRKAQATAASRMLKSHNGITDSSNRPITSNTSRETTPTSTKERSPPFGSQFAKSSSERSQVHSSSLPSKTCASPRSSQLSYTTPLSTPQRFTAHSHNFKHESPVDSDRRAHQRVHWQTSNSLSKQILQGTPAASAASQNTSQLTIDDLAMKMRELELVLVKERQERHREKEERQRLQELLMERDKTIQELKREITFLHQELETIDGDNKTLQTENQTLLKAITRLSVNK